MTCLLLGCYISGADGRCCYGYNVISSQWTSQAATSNFNYNVIEVLVRIVIFPGGENINYVVEACMQCHRCPVLVVIFPVGENIVYTLTLRQIWVGPRERPTWCSQSLLNRNTRSSSPVTPNRHPLSRYVILILILSTDTVYIVNYMVSGRLFYFIVTIEVSDLTFKTFIVTIEVSDPILRHSFFFTIPHVPN